MCRLTIGTPMQSGNETYGQTWSLVY